MRALHVQIISANSGANPFQSGYGQPSKDECDEFIRFATGSTLSVIAARTTSATSARSHLHFMTATRRPRFAAGPDHVNYVKLVQALS